MRISKEAKELIGKDILKIWLKKQQNKKKRNKKKKKSINLAKLRKKLKEKGIETNHKK
jgi:hypothetical protein